MPVNATWPSFTMSWNVPMNRYDQPNQGGVVTGFNYTLIDPKRNSVVLCTGYVPVSMAVQNVINVEFSTNSSGYLILSVSNANPITMSLPVGATGGMGGVIAPLNQYALHVNPVNPHGVLSPWQSYGNVFISLLTNFVALPSTATPTGITFVWDPLPSWQLIQAFDAYYAGYGDQIPLQSLGLLTLDVYDMTGKSVGNTSEIYAPSAIVNATAPVTFQTRLTFTAGMPGTMYKAILLALDDTDERSVLEPTEFVTFTTAGTASPLALPSACFVYSGFSYTQVSVSVVPSSQCVVTTDIASINVWMVPTVTTTSSPLPATLAFVVPLSAVLSPQVLNLMGLSQGTAFSPVLATINANGILSTTNTTTPSSILVYTIVMGAPPPLDAPPVPVNATWPSFTMSWNVPMNRYHQPNQGGVVTGFNYTLIDPKRNSVVLCTGYVPVSMAVQNVINVEFSTNSSGYLILSVSNANPITMSLPVGATGGMGGVIAPLNQYALHVNPVNPHGVLSPWQSYGNVFISLLTNSVALPSTATPTGITFVWDPLPSWQLIQAFDAYYAGYGDQIPLQSLGLLTLDVYDMTGKSVGNTSEIYAPSAIVNATAPVTFQTRLTFTAGMPGTMYKAILLALDDTDERSVLEPTEFVTFTTAGTASPLALPSACFVYSGFSYTQVSVSVVPSSQCVVTTDIASINVWMVPTVTTTSSPLPATLAFVVPLSAVLSPQVFNLMGLSQGTAFSPVLATINARHSVHHKHDDAIVDTRVHHCDGRTASAGCPPRPSTPRGRRLRCRGMCQ